MHCEGKCYLQSKIKQVQADIDLHKIVLLQSHHEAIAEATSICEHFYPHKIYKAVNNPFNDHLHVPPVIEDIYRPPQHI